MFWGFFCLLSCIVIYFVWPYSVYFSFFSYRKSRLSWKASKRTLIRFLWNHRKSWLPLSHLPQLLSCVQSLISPCRRWIMLICCPLFTWTSECMAASPDCFFFKGSFYMHNSMYIVISFYFNAPGWRLLRWSFVTHKVLREFWNSTKTVYEKFTLCPVMSNKWRLIEQSSR